MAFSPPTATGWAGFWGSAPNSYSMLFARAAPERVISHALAKGGLRQLRRVMRTLNGAAPGSPANESYARVAASSDPGGVRAIETVVASSGNTTTAQQTYIQNEIIDRLFNAAPTTYPVDTSGNGGGGKLGR